MAYRVTGDEYRDFDGQLCEIKRQLRQPSGYPFDPARLRIALQAVIEGRFDDVAAVSLSALLHDKTKDGWTLVEHVSRRIASARDLELVPFLREGETSVGGEELVRRARIEIAANYGQEDAEYLLAHQSEIPAEFRRCELVFTGTVWQNAGGHRSVPHLFWHGERWILRWVWLGDDFYADGRLVRPRK